MKIFLSRTSKLAAQAVVASIAAAALSGCYVVPLQPMPAPTGAAGVVPAGPPHPASFSARLYPANELAGGYGMVSAVVTNDLNGRGHFSTEGMANGAGNHGSFLNCRYTMNSATLGTGTCRHSNGAVFTMHIGS